ncbi:MAG TPA: response regulator [Thermoanaerobaculia bacterium]
MLQPSEAPGPRILIVDDQPSNVRLLEHTLRRAGYAQVMSTTEPRQVAGLHLQHDYDLILLDLQMPALNGFEVMAQLQEIRAAHPVSILVLSADGTQTAAALTEGADAFIAKPFKLPEVVERIRVLLKARP